MSVTIKTNHQWRELVYREDVPAKVLKSEFSYQSATDDIDGFFRYRGQWYHLDGFMSCNDNPDLKNWDGYASDSYFSGVVIKFSKDCERIKVGTYFS